MAALTYQRRNYVLFQRVWRTVCQDHINRLSVMTAKPIHKPISPIEKLTNTVANIKGNYLYR